MDFQEYPKVVQYNGQPFTVANPDQEARALKGLPLEGSLEEPEAQIAAENAKAEGKSDAKPKAKAKVAKKGKK